MSASLQFSGLLICCLFTSTVLAETADLQRCLSIDNDSQRLSCYDKALGRGFITAPQAPAPETVAPVPETATADALTPVPSVEPATPAPSAVVAEPAAPAMPAEKEAEFGLPQETDWDAVKDNRITAAVVAVDKTPLGAIIVELDNKHVWKQVDDKRLTLRKGDEVTIRGGMGGSYYLAKTSGSRSLRVKRIK